MRQKRDPFRRHVLGVVKPVAPAGCPLEQCSHLGMWHDVAELDGSDPTCTVATCTCGKAPGSPGYRRAELTRLVEETALCASATRGTDWPFRRDAELVPRFEAWAGKHETPVCEHAALSAFAKLCQDRAENATRNADLVRERPMLRGQEKMLREQARLWEWAAEAARDEAKRYAV